MSDDKLAPSRLLKTSAQLTPETVAWLKSNPLGIVGRGSTPSVTIRAILEREMGGDGIQARADKLAELTERIEKLEALAEARAPLCHQVSTAAEGGTVK